uniref:Uncharacterized protein n=1 Tax=Macaca fascicularis TaxID=9541 RepID=Q9BE77_MACFA|nr:hypothetical protein [Macaca fascicularis]
MLLCKNKNTHSSPFTDTLFHFASWFAIVLGSLLYQTSLVPTIEENYVSCKYPIINVDCAALLFCSRHVDNPASLQTPKLSPFFSLHSFLLIFQSTWPFSFMCVK